MTEAQLRRNLRLYGWFKVFTKRVFIPLTSIYLVDVGRLSLSQLGLTITIGGLVTLVSQIPTGYYADRRTRRGAMMIGAALLALATALLAIWPAFVGAIVSAVVMAVGYSFVSGSGSALMHDALEQCGKANSFIKHMGKAQSKGLIGNLVLVGLVPMTYGLNPRMPFVLGTVAFGVLFGISWALVEPKRTKPTHDGQTRMQFFVSNLRVFVRRRTVWMFLAVGLIDAAYMVGLDFHALVMKDLGLLAQYIGWAYSAASLIGAVGGHFIHHLQRFSFRAFALFDAIGWGGFLVLVGLTRNLPVIVVGFVIHLAFWRLRGIIYQHHMLTVFKGSSNKAMLVSLTGTTQQLFTLAIPMTLVFSVNKLGYYSGYVIFGTTLSAVMCALFWYAFVRLRAGVGNP